MTSARHLLAGLLTCALLGGCSWLAGPDEEHRVPGVSAFRPAASMTADGVALAKAAGLEDSAPSYDLAATVTPRTGVVTGTVDAELPVGQDVDDVHLRYFAAHPDFDAKAMVGEVTVDGAAVEVRRDATIVTVPLPAQHGARVHLVVPFSYTLGLGEGGGGLLDSLGGMGGPAEVGLLARHEHAWNLGHWFPIWIPEGNSADPEPAGYGDLGNFPPALMRLRLTTPDAWTVVDGGVRVSEQPTGTDEVTVVSEGYGMNDVAVSLLRGYASRRVELDGGLAGVTVTAYAPEADGGELPEVLDEAVAALVTLSEQLVPYPWREFDIVSAPLGAGVGGMEWPGATWIEPALFAGGIPGLGGLEDLLGGTDGEGLDELDTLLGDLGPGGETGRLVETLRAWTIAHEVGHEWWHVLVGNDSVRDPVVDEPLAQYSACLVLRVTLSGDVDTLCDAHIDSAYEQMRLLGDEDGPAARATDEFASSGQYAGLVYGKAAAFYRRLEAVFGVEAVAEALAGIAAAHAFTMMTGEELRTALSRELGSPVRFDALWRRWMEGTHGDRDLATGS